MAASDALSVALCKSFRNLKTSFTVLKEKQEEAAVAVLGGKDASVCLPTGY
jgi:hypothetical protein